MKLKKIKEFILSNKVYILISLILMIVNIFYCFSFGNINFLNRLVCLGLSIFLEILFIILLYFFEKKKLKIENKFLIIYIIIGILYMTAIPMSRIPDEYNHFLRTYEISNGNILSKQDKKTKNGGNEMPSNINVIETLKYEDVKDNFEVTPNKDKTFVGFSNTALYSPISYGPQVIGVLIGKLFNTSLLVQAYLGRLMNFIVFLTVMYFSIKYMPIKKELLLFISFLPITIQEAVSLSPDALTISSASALVSFVIYMKYEKKSKMSKINYITMTVLPIVLAMCKIVYLPLCLLLFLIPKERFGSLKKKNIIVLTLAVIVVFLNLFWTSKASIFLDANLHGSNSSKQIDFIINNPLKYSMIIFRTFDYYGDFHLFNMMGRYLSYLDVNVFPPYIYLSIIILILLIFTNEKKLKKVDNRDKYLMLFCVISTILLIFTSIYIQWSSYMLEYVDGVQGRYYIPVIILLGIIMSNLIDIKNNVDFSNKCFLIFLIFENISALIALYMKFI